MKEDSDAQETAGSPYPSSQQREDEERHVIIILKVVIVSILVLGAVSAIFIILLGPPPDIPPPPPPCRWGAPDVVSPTSATVCFGRIAPEPRPTLLEIVLTRNGTEEGLYRFVGDEDGTLNHVSGTDIGSLTYNDLADNQKVNVGDEIALTDLAPDSNYELVVIWRPSGDPICTKTFSTPP